MQWSIVFYASKRGEPLVRSFIDRQGEQTSSKITRLLELLEIHGPKLTMPYARYLGQGLYELRIRDRNEVRIFYACISRQQVVILLHAFNKRTQRLPTKELKVARERQAELTEV